jgi:hypothetical protein
MWLLYVQVISRLTNFARVEGEKAFVTVLSLSNKIGALWQVRFLAQVIKRSGKSTQELSQKS